MQGEDYGSFWVQLPCKFSVWDTDKDGSITRPEFAFAGHTGVEDSNTVFKKVDKDGQYCEFKINDELFFFTENV